MPPIFQNDFSAGWRPSDDLIGGPKNSLVRMQNVKLDELGALTLIPGSAKCNTSQFTYAPHTIYSKVLNGTRYRFDADVHGQVLVDALGDFSAAFDVAVGLGSGSKAAFNTAYNFAMICSGNIKYKLDPAISNLGFQLGPGAPTVAPTLSVNNPYVKDVTGAGASYVALVGTVPAFAGTTPYIEIQQDATILSGVANLVIGSAVDSTNLSSSSKGLDTDIFTIEIKAVDPTQLAKVTVIFKDFTDNKNYFQFSWEASYFDGIPPGQAVNLQTTRGSFQVVGKTAWTNIGEVVVAVDVFNTPTNFFFDNLKFKGGTLGSISGNDIRYLQVNTCSAHGFTSYSGISPITNQIVVNQSSVNVTPQDPVTGDIQNDGWAIYRSGGGLDAWYQVKTGGATFAAFDDQMSNDTALAINVKANIFLTAIHSITDDIQSIVGPFFNRYLYFTNKSIYITLDGNPEMYASNTGIISPYANSGEIFMWAKKFGNSAILIGTSNDIYEITGTLAELPDGTIDVIVRPTGCKNPPINDACAASANSLYYIASDGPRKVTFASNEPFWTELDLLFKGKDRYSMVAPRVRANNQDKFILEIAKNELYLSLVDTNGLRKMWAYDLIRGYGYEFKSDDGGYAAATCLFVEEDGSLLAGFSDTGNKYIRVLNTGTLIDGTTNPAIFLRTKVFNGDIPYQRKDSFTLKLKIDTGSSGIEFRIYKDESASYTSLGFIASASLLEKFIDLSSIIGVCKSYQLEINGNCPRFKLSSFEIDYTERPVPLSYFRSQPTNYGIQGRKRLYEIPIVIDTLGSPVTMTPIVDGVAQTGVSFTTTGKTGYNYLFNPAVAGIDVNYTLLETGGAQFEFYGDTQPKVIEPIPDAVKYFIIPFSNLGTYARKRIIAFAIIIDTNSANVNFTPKIDGVVYPAKVVNTLDRKTFIYYFDAVTTGTDIGGILSSTSTFEFYGIALEECISEKLPPSSTAFVIPTTNLGTYARKRFIAYAFVIDTKGFTVTFTPTIDNTAGTSSSFSTNGKRTYIHYFDTRTEGIDITGVLISPGLHNFEFYAVSLEECISEKLPPSCTYLVIPPNNYDLAAKKRIRTIPLVIDTKGANVVFTPTIDGVAYPSSTFNTSGKTTVLHYFSTDAFGIDISGILDGTTNFEFYGLPKPEVVEAIPVGKLFDQLGPVEFLRSGNIKGFRVRMIAEGTLVNYTVYVDDVARYSSSFTTLANVDKVYEVPWINKFLNGTTCRIELTSSSPMHRYHAQLKVSITGQSKLWSKLA